MDDYKKPANVETASVAASEATTLVPGDDQPDTSLIYVSIPLADLAPAGTDPSTESSPATSNAASSSSALRPPKPSWLERLAGAVTGKSFATPEQQGFRTVQMTRADFRKYWARDEEGRYVGTEPEGSGREWYREKLRAYGRACDGGPGKVQAGVWIGQMGVVV
ncbi:hypothetical protein LTR60_003001 [Cryomyces antarcticus]|nr:hypothetical protein LTR60_003001 [Cryomyces antarcticus]